MGAYDKLIGSISHDIGLASDLVNTPPRHHPISGRIAQVTGGAPQGHAPTAAMEVQ
jgi:hypothetical protein